MHVVAAPGQTETEHPRRAEEKRLCYLALRVQRADGAPDTPGQGDYLGLGRPGCGSPASDLAGPWVWLEQTPGQGTHCWPSPFQSVGTSVE